MRTRKKRVRVFNILFINNQHRHTDQLEDVLSIKTFGPSLCAFCPNVLINLRVLTFVNIISQSNEIHYVFCCHDISGFSARHRYYHSFWFLPSCTWSIVAHLDTTMVSQCHTKVPLDRELKLVKIFWRAASWKEMEMMLQVLSFCLHLLFLLLITEWGHFVCLFLLSKATSAHICVLQKC